MVTCAQVGTVKPNPRFNFHTSHIYPLPKSPSIGLSDPNWRVAMYDEYNALVKNSTWILVPKPSNDDVVRSMWLFRHKYHADGSLSRYKARLVANGCTQQAPRAWFQRFASYALRVGFSSSRCDSSLFIYRHESKLGSDGDLISDLTLYRSLAGGLQYLTFTRPDISYAVQQVCLQMHDPREPHLAALKRVLRYVGGTLDSGLQLYASITAKQQHTLFRSIAEAEYIGVANRTKHIDIDIHFVLDMVARGQVRVHHVPSRYQRDGLGEAAQRSHLGLRIRPDPIPC
uniref:Ribonuclease H-like domain-containing protein n=1 Tax=Tanacetum cinerariifolium TaxID=118510 RepID=A0A6L2KM26_TANCI|nr:ribonuclease H-like domain-containing protein [Tanacetum cinerariifolium]